VILRSLHIISITAAGRDRPQEMSLTKNFKTSLRLALEGGGSQNSFGVPSTLPVPPEMDVAHLDRYARRKWEDILHYVVNSVGISGRVGESQAGGHEHGGPKKSVKDLLLAGRLVEHREGYHHHIGITQAGFAFLLQEANAQVWTLLLLWLEAAADRGAQPGAGSGSGKGTGTGTDSVDSVDMLSFLFMLASLELGRAYDADALPDNRRDMLPALVDFGLVYIPPHSPRQYFPTRLATTLTSSSMSLRTVSAGFAAAAASSAAGNATTDGTSNSPEQNNNNNNNINNNKGSIILETNYRLYAYTSSPLQIAVLALFTKLDMRFAGMVSGRLTREALRVALGHGITADQIIAYLAAHAHEQMRRAAAASGKPVLPPTVVDALRLWQLETERMRATPGFLFKDFDGPAEYEGLVGYADEVGVLVWRNDRRQMFFASKHEQLRDWLKTRKKTE
jgi:transcription initiation factor TFIIH subunit 4